ncbi:MAG: hypothetical protein NTX24_02095 [Candidatus Pacearchaeota archaeon]|nr:hypothetical protein [Candidatus Pacearchaeota archaeon]
MAIEYIASLLLRPEDIGRVLNEAGFGADDPPIMGEEKGVGPGFPIKTLTTKYLRLGSSIPPTPLSPLAMEIKTYNLSSQVWHVYHGGGRILCKVSTPLDESKAYGLIPSAGKGEVDETLEAIILGPGSSSSHSC